MPSFTIELISPALPKKSWDKISQIRTLTVEGICKKLAEDSPEELAKMVEGLNEIVGLSQVRHTRGSKDVPI